LIDYLIIQVVEKKDSGPVEKKEGTDTKTDRQDKRADSTDSGLSSACINSSFD